MQQSFSKQKYTIATPIESANHLGTDGFTCRDNWWSNHRFNLVLNFLPSNSMRQSLLDFGCGNGLWLRFLRRNNCPLSLTGYDPFFMSYASDASPRDLCIHTNLNDLKGKEYDCITALDVIEHIHNDKQALMQIGVHLKTGGNLLLTVPAYPLLFSRHDAVIGHYRRYTRRSITELLEESGYTVLHATYFFSFLVPLAAARKYYLLLCKNYHCASTPVDPLKIFSVLTSIESKFLRLTNFYLPLGTSIFAAAQKIKSGGG